MKRSLVVLGFLPEGMKSPGPRYKLALFGGEVVLVLHQMVQSNTSSLSYQGKQSLNQFDTQGFVSSTELTSWLLSVCDESSQWVQ